MEMEPWEVWIRSTELHKFVQQHEFGLWPLMQTLHLIGFTLLFGTVGLFDIRALGVAKGIPLQAIHRLIPWGVAGFVGNILLGIVFFSVHPEQYACSRHSGEDCVGAGVGRSQPRERLDAPPTSAIGSSRPGVDPQTVTPCHGYLAGGRAPVHPPRLDWTDRYPAIAAAAAKVRAETFTLDGEAVVSGADGVAVFDALHRRRKATDAMLYAFDLLELNGKDLRPLPLSDRKAKLARLLARAPASIVFNEHTDEDGTTVFRHACKLGLEGIVS
jgi:hypothetical protein